MEDLNYIKKLLKKGRLKYHIFTLSLSIIGVLYSFFSLFGKSGSFKTFLTQQAFLFVLFALVNGLIILNSWLLTNNVSVSAGVISGFRGIGNGKSILVELNGKEIACTYYIRRQRHLYKGMDVLVVKRNNTFYADCLPIVFPGR